MDGGAAGLNQAEGRQASGTYEIYPAAVFAGKRLGAV